MAKGPEYVYVEKPSMELLERLGWTPVDAFTEILGAQVTHRFETRLPGRYYVHTPEKPIDGKTESGLAPTVDSGAQLFSCGRT